MSSTVVSQPATSSIRRKLLWWLPTLIWLGLQAFFSTDTFSAENTGSILWRIVHALYGNISDHQFAVVHFLIRKGAHFITYGLLSVFAFFSWRATLPSPARWRFHWSMLAVLLAGVAGSLDEFHQMFVPSRTASPRDVLLDTVGAICFQIVLAVILGRRSKMGVEKG